MKVLFVCLGNICRSPMAEAMFRNKITNEKIEVDSAGTGSRTKGMAPHKGTKEILNKLNISYENMHARQITKEDFIDYDYIFAMDQQNFKDLKLMSNKKYHHKIHLFLDILENPKKKEVPDPWYTGNFKETEKLIGQANELWFNKIKNQSE